MSELLVFAGTTEGRILLEALSRIAGGSGLTVHACVATDYGKELLPENLAHIHIHTGRLTEEDMSALMKEHSFDFVIDTTHPYARLVSQNIKTACKRSGCNYIRVLRASGITQSMRSKGFLDEGGGLIDAEGCLIDVEDSLIDTEDSLAEEISCRLFESHEDAAEYLNQTAGNVLLTIGSKELHKYTKVEGYQQRLFPRVLPMAEVLESCFASGFSGKQLICMQGPFSTEFNIALMKQINAQYIVTKDSGETGGFLEKYQAAKETGATLLVVGRGQEEDGISLESLMEFLERTCQLRFDSEEEPDLGQWFPLFTDIKDKLFVVIGAGKIAKRRIETLLQFNCRVKVVAEEALPEVIAYAGQKRLELHLKSYAADDLTGADYVLAATNRKQTNYDIYQKCKRIGITVNIADDKAKSDFYFPGMIRKNGVTVGVTAEGKDHRLAKRATKAIAKCLEKI